MSELQEDTGEIPEPVEMKTCTRCQQSKIAETGYDTFTKNGNRYKRGFCKVCRRAAQNKAKRAAYVPRPKGSKFYKMSDPEWTNLFDENGQRKEQ